MKGFIETGFSGGEGRPSALHTWLGGDPGVFRRRKGNAALPDVARESALFYCDVFVFVKTVNSMVDSQAIVETSSGQRLINRLCKHWAHKLEVDAASGRVVFPGGECLMTASETQLKVDLEAQDAEQLARLQGVVASHLERMASKETLRIHWQ